MTVELRRKGKGTTYHLVPQGCDYALCGVTAVPEPKSADWMNAPIRETGWWLPVADTGEWPDCKACRGLSIEGLAASQGVSPASDPTMILGSLGDD